MRSIILNIIADNNILSLSISSPCMFTVCVYVYCEKNRKPDQGPVPRSLLNIAEILAENLAQQSRNSQSELNGTTSLTLVQPGFPL